MSGLPLSNSPSIPGYASRQKASPPLQRDGAIPELTELGKLLLIYISAIPLSPSFLSFPPIIGIRTSLPTSIFIFIIPLTLDIDVSRYNPRWPLFRHSENNHRRIEPCHEVSYVTTFLAEFPLSPRGESNPGNVQPSALRLMSMKQILSY